MRTISICAAALASLSFVAPARAANPPLTVKLKSCPTSSVAGFAGNYPGGAPGTMRQFLGIPYAAPPTGANRWQPPKPVTCWSGARNAKNFGGQCAQGANTNEDCLFVNVFTRATGAVANQPVLVFIHGGGLTSGSGSFQLNPINFIEKGVVVVTLNYRIGALGFLAHPGLDNKATSNTGNYGILDQIAALKWVKANIAKFGGNPNNVTISGQSAGGLSVLVHLVSPKSAGLFHKAIISSGALYNAATPLADAEQQGVNFATGVGCNSGTNAQKAACLRAKPVSTILANQMTLGQSAKLLRQDDVVITDTLRNLVMTGKFKKVPIINGSMHDEYRFHIAGNFSLGTGDTCHYTSNLVPDAQANFSGAVSYSSAMTANMGSSLSSLVMPHYPAGANGQSANTAYAKANTDGFFACRAFRVSKWMAQKGGKIFAYEFNDQHAPIWLWPSFKLHDGTSWKYGAYHGGDLPSLFRMNGFDACGGAVPAMTAPQKKLSGQMVTYLTTFMRTGNPNPATGVKPPNWPQFSGASGKLLSLAPSGPKLLAASAFDTSHKCAAFWDSNTQ
jgi:para-nitrobenzyl esterase